MTVDCTAPSSLTREEALKRLAAVEPLPRGERLAAVVGEFALTKENRLRMQRLGSHGWKTRKTPWPQRTRLLWFDAEMACNTPEEHDRNIARWRALAAPLRRAREERQVWKRMHALRIRSTERCGVSSALLAFFTDLAVLTRKIPAPCPWCKCEVYGKEPSDGCWYMRCNTDECLAEGPQAHGKQNAVRKWNRVAVPLAFERLKGDGI